MGAEAAPFMTTEQIIRYLKVVLLFLVVWGLIWAYNNLGWKKIDGRDMDPTIPPDTFKFSAPGFYPPDRLQRDDIIFYDYVHAGKTQRSYAGRVIGLPGDRVRIFKGEVFVNENAIPFDYVSSNYRSGETQEEIMVPRDSVYVLGDNRKSSAAYDSRGIGPVGMWAITGKVR